jgi:hypothetical protein
MIIVESVKMGIDEYLKLPKKDVISERTAYRKFGKDNVDNWIKNGFITQPMRNGSKANSRKNFSYRELSGIAKRYNVTENK